MGAGLVVKLAEESDDTLPEGFGPKRLGWRHGGGRIDFGDGDIAVTIIGIGGGFDDYMVRVRTYHEEIDTGEN